MNSNFVQDVLEPFYSLVNQHNIRGIEQSVLRELASLAYTCEEVYPSNRWLSERLNCSVRAVQYSIGRLCDRGIITKESRFKAAGDRMRQQTNRYIVNIPNMVYSFTKICMGGYLQSSGRSSADINGYFSCKAG